MTHQASNVQNGQPGTRGIFIPIHHGLLPHYSVAYATHGRKIIMTAGRILDPHCRILEQSVNEAVSYVPPGS